MKKHAYSDPYRLGRCLTCGRPATKNVLKNGVWVKVSAATKNCR